MRPMGTTLQRVVPFTLPSHHPHHWPFTSGRGCSTEQAQSKNHADQGAKQFFAHSENLPFYLGGTVSQFPLMDGRR